MTYQVTISMAHGGQVEFELYKSVLDAFAYDRQLDAPILFPYTIDVAGPSGRLGVQRHTQFDVFLNKATTPWLLSMDTDHGFEHDAIHALLASADPVTRPIMGALCFGSGRSGGALFPTVMVEHEGRHRPALKYPRRKIVECHSTGLAFILIHRSVLEAMADKYGFGTDERPLSPWVSDDFHTEPDLVFCQRARDCGFPVHVNTAVEAPHKKPQFLTEEFYDLVTLLQEAQEATG